jgi:hypothetical protein
MKKYKLGHYSIYINQDIKNPMILIYKDTGFNKISQIWKTYSNYPFLQIGSAINLRSPIYNGNYQLLQEITYQSDSLSISSINCLSSSISISGILFKQKFNSLIANYTFKFYLSKYDKLAFDISTFSNISSKEIRLFFNYHSFKGEKFFGFGESFSYLNLNNKVVPILVSEQGVGRGNNNNSN